MKMWSAMVGLLALGLLASGCAKSSGTETGNPPLLANYLVRVAEAEEASVEVTGDAGSITPGGGEVTVENARTGDSTTVDVATDGSFAATVLGTTEDDFVLTVEQDGLISEPQTITPNGPNGPLVACGEMAVPPPPLVSYVELEGNTMEVGFVAGVGCGPRTAALCYSEKWAESSPIQVQFRVIDGYAAWVGEARAGCDEPDLSQQAHSVRVDLAPFRAAYADAYRSDSGAARISLADCSGSSCSVVYRWGDDADCGEGDPDCPL